MLKSFKVMLVPNNRQRTRLFQFAGAARFAYNWALRKEIDAYEADEKFISSYDMTKKFTVLKNSGEYPWLKSISSQATFQAVRDCADAYIKFFKKQSLRPRFKSKRRGDFSFYQATDKIKITTTHVKLEAIATSKRKNRQRLNWFRLAEHGRIPVGVKYFNPRITFDGLNWWLSVAVEFADPKPAENCGEALGIDLGIKNLATCSDGTIYPNINRTSTVRRLKKKLRRLQRAISRKYEMNKNTRTLAGNLSLQSVMSNESSLDEIGRTEAGIRQAVVATLSPEQRQRSFSRKYEMNKKKGESYKKTRNIIKSEQKLLRIHHRLANIRQNYRHQITSRIIGRKPNPIMLEDLNVRGMMSNRHLAKAVQEQGFYEFRRQIEYKAAWAGLRVVIADRFYPSSKNCIACGHVKKNLHLSERIYHCEHCGNEIDRDLQAAINLKRYAS